ncbi:DUF411 domain-containing protein [Vibrio alginolyticus]|uniref:DUF411 domain-containing protein n=1 Tax=Vibrio alginolyticus TaxID=663 RepID=UPI002022F1C5|nr:DUF411 domain-containing protein [Vibrio alginolyticus]
MKKYLNITAISALVFSVNAFANPVVELYKSPTCGCCSQWAATMEKEGYQVNVHKQHNWDSVKAPFNMPKQLSSCHTAIIGGYMIEGHVPEAEVARLLKERPANISGISVPGMPRYSPGMARDGEAYKNFNVVAFDKNGKPSLYKKYD